MTKAEEKLADLKGFLYVAHEGTVALLCKRKITAEQRRAIKAVKTAMRYLQAYEPEMARWKRGR